MDGGLSMKYNVVFKIFTVLRLGKKLGRVFCFSQAQIWHLLSFSNTGNLTEVLATRTELGYNPSILACSIGISS